LLKTCPALNPDGSCVLTDAQRTVGYVANNPNAQYIRAGAGAQATAGRNKLLLPGISNVDFSVFKNFTAKERYKFQWRMDMFNVFNHAQYTPGSINGVEATSQTGVTSLITANGNSLFNRPDLVFSNHPRIIQMALRFNF